MKMEKSPEMMAKCHDKHTYHVHNIIYIHTYIYIYVDYINIYIYKYKIIII